MSKLLLPNTRIFSLATENVPLQRKQDSPSWQIFLWVSLCMFDDFTCHSWESRQYPGHASRKFAREKHELYLSCILIGQQENKSSYVTEIVLSLGFALRRRYFSEGEKRRPEMRLRFAGHEIYWCLLVFILFDLGVFLVSLARVLYAWETLTLLLEK